MRWLLATRTHGTDAPVNKNVVFIFSWTGLFTLAEILDMFNTSWHYQEVIAWVEVNVGEAFNNQEVEKGESTEKESLVWKMDYWTDYYIV